MLVRNNEQILIPDLSTALMEGDRILLCGMPDAKSALPNILNNSKTLAYIIDGIEVPNSIVWRWFRKLTESKSQTE
jgi:NhaP-type Na+/H+ and K+/H+ antiporter